METTQEDQKAILESVVVKQQSQDIILKETQTDVKWIINNLKNKD